VTELLKRHLRLLEIHIRWFPQVRDECEDFRRELRHCVQPLVRPHLIARPGLVGKGERIFHTADILSERSDRIRTLPAILRNFCIRPLFQKRAFEDSHGPQS